MSSAPQLTHPRRERVDPAGPAHGAEDVAGHTVRSQAETRRPRPRGVPLAFGIGLTGLLVFAVGTVSPALALPAPASEALYVAVYLAAPALVAWRAVWHDLERRAWLLIAGGMLSSALGYAYYFAVVSRDATPPAPSPSDALWIAYYVLSCGGLLLLVRTTLLDAPRALLWMSSLGGLLAGAAVVAATLFDPVVEFTGGAPLAVATAVAYPLSDVIIVALLFMVFAVRRWHPGRRWLVIGCAWIFTAAADIVYAYKASTGSYVGNEVLDVMWPLAMLSIAFAAWRWPDPERKVRLPAVATIATPVAFGLIAGGLLVYGNFAPLNTTAVWLATSTLVAAVAALAVVEHNVGRLRAQSRRDPLTGLLNHREFHDAVSRHIELGRPFAVAMLDLDGFKHVNDLYGHAEGDRLLETLARALEGTCRRDDALCRVGGDEFALVLPGLTRSEAEALAGRMVGAATTADTAIGASVGFAQWPDDGPDKAALLLRADASLYRAKHARHEPEPPLEQVKSAAAARPGTDREADRAAEGPPAPVCRRTGVDRYRGSHVAAAAAALAALVLAARFAVPERDSGVLMLLVVPVALLALRFAVWGGVIGALGAVLMLALPPLLGYPGQGALGYVSRSIGFVTIGLLVGRLSADARGARTLLEHRVVRGLADVSSVRDAVAAERDFLAAVLESLEEGVVACDGDGVLSFFNDATRRLHGLPADSIPASEWAEHYDLYRADGVTPLPGDEIPLMRAFAGEAIREVAMVIAPEGREPRTLMATGRPIVAPDGRKNGAVVAMRDVTAQLHLQRQLEVALAEAMTRLGRAVAYRDTDTGEHVERMSIACGLLAERAGLDRDRCAMIEIASRLHDIGKVAVPDAVLLKSGPLNGQEWELMEAHALMGHELLTGSGNEVLELAATIALSHHERIDGSGYPHALRADAIPIEARIAAIADAFDALTSDRPYRSAFTKAQAVAIMKRERGTHFDPALLDLFVADPPSSADYGIRSADGALARPEPADPRRSQAAVPDDVRGSRPGPQSDAQPTPGQPQPFDSNYARTREVIAEAAADVHEALADLRDDEVAARERSREAAAGATGCNGVDDRQPSRDRRWAADERIRAAARRAQDVRSRGSG